MSKAVKDIRYNTTRPTSVVIMMLLYQGIKLIWPVSAIVDKWVTDIILAVGATGIIEKTWKNRKEIIAWIKGLLKKKETVNINN